MTTVLDTATAWLARHSVTLLRVSLGLVFLAFGALKFFPGVSPAEEIVQRTLDALSFGIIGPDLALLMTAVLECVVGLVLITGVALRAGLVVLAGAFVGILSPLVLFTGDLVGSGVTLMAQYVFKDIVLVAAALVVTAHALGARMTVPAGPMVAAQFERRA